MPKNGAVQHGAQQQVHMAHQDQRKAHAHKPPRAPGCVYEAWGRGRPEPGERNREGPPGHPKITGGHRTGREMGAGEQDQRDRKLPNLQKRQHLIAFLRAGPPGSYTWPRPLPRSQASST